VNATVDNKPFVVNLAAVKRIQQVGGDHGGGEDTDAGLRIRRITHVSPAIFFGVVESKISFGKGAVSTKDGVGDSSNEYAGLAPTLIVRWRGGS
jgi:hypothetical protein